MKDKLQFCSKYGWLAKVHEIFSLSFVGFPDRVANRIRKQLICGELYFVKGLLTLLFFSVS